MRTLAILASVLLLNAPATAAQPGGSCTPVTAKCLASLSMEPVGPEMEIADPLYLRIVARGLAAVPELAALLEDPTATAQPVPLFGGTWAVGDIARCALSDILRDAPWLSFVSPGARKAGKDCGFCAYWQYVRASRRNRATLARHFRAWYSLHRTTLTWKPSPHSLTGGSFVLPEGSPTH